MLAGGGLDGVIRLWGVADPAHPSALGQPLTGGGGAVDSVAFSRDGRTLASGGVGGTIRLWSLPQTVLTGGTIGFNSVAFSPDGHTLASSGYGGMVRLWGAADPAHPRPLGPPLVGGGIDTLAFSTDEAHAGRPRRRHRPAVGCR
jgi:WD40 repeat protein